MKIKRQISQKATKRFKMMVFAAACLFAVSYMSQDITQEIANYQWFVDAAEDEAADPEVLLVTIDDVEDKMFYQINSNKTGDPLQWKDNTYKHYAYVQRANGFVEEYYDGDDLYGSYCMSSMVLIPGTTLMPSGFLGFIYVVFLGFLFLGISIIADIFMEAIEVITSQTVMKEHVDQTDGKTYHLEVPVWNATIANLTLMALGSSAPEILLSVIEALGTLGEPAGPLGASTIVGSAAFNLLVISAVSVVAVDEPKKILDVSVFGVTSIFSLFAYVWLYSCLVITSEGVVTITEAWLTLIYFFILVALSFMADRAFAGYLNKQKSEDDKKQEAQQEELKIKKNHLRHIANSKGGEKVIMEVAQGISNAATKKISENDQREIRGLFSEILGTKDLQSCDVKELHAALQPDSLLERFAARNANKLNGPTKDFLSLKGQRGQIENQGSSKIEQENELIGFKCLHYSVTESSGFVEITVVKKVINQDVSFGLRTKDGTAKDSTEYNKLDEVFNMKKRDTEKTIQIKIIDNSDWQPDLDFTVELYDPNSSGMTRFSGDDTITKITILDEDFPGTLGFENTDIIASKFQERVDIKIIRSEGSDGKISCMIKTEQLTETGRAGIAHNSAAEFDDYLPKHEKVEFDNNENEKTISISLVNDKMVQQMGKTAGNKVDEDDMDVEQQGHLEELQDVMFKVKLDKAEPQGVKISKKNMCTVTIVQNEDAQKEQDDHAKLMDYFMQSQEKTFSSQMKDAVKLGPCIDEDNLIIDEVTLSEGLFHFACIGWKVIFALVPPAQMGGGVPAFFIALAFIGIVTMFVGEVATILGCAIGLKASVTAITFVAMGTSLPDTLASMTAARSFEFADSAIGNVTGSNCVNVFLGLGLPWVISAHYNEAQGQPFLVPAGDLAFSVMLFLITSVICFMILIARRIVIGGELGGPKASAYGSAFCMFSLWLIYVIFSSLKAYGAI